MDIEEVKARTDLVELVEGSGVALYGSNGTLSGICPFHQDRKPSLKVHQWKQWWWCYACNMGGDVIEWVKKRDGTDFSAAIQTLERGATGIPIYRKPVEREPYKPTFIPHTIIQQFQQHVHHILPYLMGERFWSKEVIRSCSVGYDPVSQRVTIPIKSPLSPEWEDIRMYDPWHRQSQKMIAYKKGVRNLPYIVQQDPLFDHMFLVEGEPDALALASLGFNVSTNTCGSGASANIWRDWNGLIRSTNVFILFDNDEAGRLATEKLSGVFPRATVISLPEKGYDITDTIKDYGTPRTTEFLYDHIRKVGRG